MVESTSFERLQSVKKSVNLAVIEKNRIDELDKLKFKV